MCGMCLLRLMDLVLASFGSFEALATPLGFTFTIWAVAVLTVILALKLFDGCLDGELAGCFALCGIGCCHDVLVGEHRPLTDPICIEPGHIPGKFGGFMYFSRVRGSNGRVWNDLDDESICNLQRTHGAGVRTEQEGCCL